MAYDALEEQKPTEYGGAISVHDYTKNIRDDTEQIHIVQRKHCAHNMQVRVVCRGGKIDNSIEARRKIDAQLESPCPDCEKERKDATDTTP